MERVRLECPVCMQEYNTSDNEPRILACGHTLCLDCIRMLLNPQLFSTITKCPICKVVIGAQHLMTANSYPKNYALLSLLQEGPKCRVHHSPVEMVCLDCKSEMCLKCVRTHSGHNIDTLDQFLVDTNKKVMEIKQVKASFKEKISKGEQVVDCKRNYLLWKTKNEHKILQKELEDRTSQIIDSINEQLEPALVKANCIAEKKIKISNSSFEETLRKWSHKRTAEEAFKIQDIDAKEIKRELRDLNADHIYDLVLETTEAMQPQSDQKFLKLLSVFNPSYRGNDSLLLMIDPLDIIVENNHIVVRMMDSNDFEPKCEDIETKFKGYQTVYVDFQDSAILKDHHHKLQFIFEEINSRNGIIEITLDLNSREIYIKSFCEVIVSLNFLKGLKKLDLKLFNARIPNVENTKLLKGLALLPSNLTELSICLNYIKVFDNQREIESEEEIRSFTNFLDRISAMTHLESLDLLLMGCDLPDKAIPIVAECLEKLDLKKLMINISCNPFLSRIGNLTSPVGKMKNLYSLGLSLGANPYVPVQELKMLITYLHDLRALTELDLYLLDIPSLDDTTIETLQRFLENNQGLTKLSILLRGDYLVSDSAIKGLISSINALQEIRHLTLNLDMINLITRKSLGLLINFLDNSKALEYFDLSLIGVIAVDDQFVEDICTSLKRHQYLKSLFITLGLSSNLTDTSIHHMIDLVTLLPYLSTLSFRILDSEEISDEGVKTLVQGFSKHQSLQNLTVDFSGCYNLSERTVEQVKTLASMDSKLRWLQATFDRCFQIRERFVTKMLH